MSGKNKEKTKEIKGKKFEETLREGIIKKESYVAPVVSQMIQNPPRLPQKKRKTEDSKESEG